MFALHVDFAALSYQVQNGVKRRRGPISLGFCASVHSEAVTSYVCVSVHSRLEPSAESGDPANEESSGWPRANAGRQEANRAGCRHTNFGGAEGGRTNFEHVLFYPTSKAPQEHRARLRQVESALLSFDRTLARPIADFRECSPIRSTRQLRERNSRVRLRSRS